MGSISSPSSGLATLLQSLCAVSPDLASVLSTAKVQSALESASPGDLVKLSDEALQLQQVSLLFGSSSGTPSTVSTATPPAATAPAAQGAQLAANVSSSQAQNLAALFGGPSTADPLLNAVG